jgi:clathrin heavy chain
MGKRSQGWFEIQVVHYAVLHSLGGLHVGPSQSRLVEDSSCALRCAAPCRAVLQVCFACVEEGEFKLAQLCGLNIIVNADDLDEVSEFYQRRGHFDQLMSLMESGLVSAFEAIQ